MSEFKGHVTVLLDECVDAIINSECSSNCVADLTFGGGGHSFHMLNKKPELKIYGVDQDDDAIKNAKKNIQEKKLEDSITILKMNFEKFPEWVNKNKPELKFRAILMDLGVSSHQFDDDERGFSYRRDGVLDMRMDASANNTLTAKTIVNKFSEKEIADIIYKYGEEKLSFRIAKNICEYRSKKEIETTSELEEIVFTSYPAKFRHGRTHPATKTFQALRIFVNREIEVLEHVLEDLYRLLDKNGRLVVITFHSLEDRIIKHKFKEFFARDKNAVKIVTKKPIYPSTIEIEKNSRSRSAKLRIIEKLN
jgi:16S rRNA (cytosine1402-N4)-methyltransferase